MRRTLPSAVLSLALLAAAAPAPAQRYPDEPGDGVADLAGVLSPADEAGIRAVVARMRANPGVELAVLTVQSVGAYGARSPEAFATGVYNQWRLGRGQRQDGVLVLLSLDDRFTRIELGDGVPADQDARMRRIVDDVMVPRFRGGDMGGGVHDGVLAVASAFGTQAPAAVGETGGTPASPPGGQGAAPQAVVPAPALPDSASAATTGPQPAAPDPRPAYSPPYTPVYPTSGYRDPQALTGPVLFVLLFCGGLVAGLGVWIVKRRFTMKCRECGLQMARLDEAADDVYLDSGRRREEVLGSVNYDVWKCAGCGHHEIVRDPRLFTRYDRCGECSCRTVATTRTTLRHPTYDSPGSAQVEKACAHCGWTDVDVVHLPRKPRPQPRSSSSSWDSSSDSSSSWGSGGSSRGGGGGSSSGRGSSGRW